MRPHICPCVNARPHINRKPCTYMRPHVCPHINMRPHVNGRPHVCPRIKNAYAGGGDTQMQGFAPWRWGYLHIFMQVLTYAGGGDTHMKGLAPWGWGYTLTYLCKASCMQVMGTLRCKVLHHGGYALTSCMQVMRTLRCKVLHHGGRSIPLPCICRWWGHSDARSCTMGVGYTLVYLCKALCMQVVGTLRCMVLYHGSWDIVIWHLTFKEVTSMLHCHGTRKGIALTQGLLLMQGLALNSEKV